MQHLENGSVHVKNFWLFFEIRKIGMVGPALPQSYTGGD